MLSTLLHSTTGLGLVAMYTITQISTKAAPMKGRAAKRRKDEISKLEPNSYTDSEGIFFILHEFLFAFPLLFGVFFYLSLQLSHGCLA